MFVYLQPALSRTSRDFFRDIAGIQREDMEILNAKFEVLHQHRMQEAEREHFIQIRSLNNEWELCLSRLEDQNAELVVAKGIAAAASLQAQEHLQNLKLIQKELQSAKLGLQLQQEQLKQREIELLVREAAWEQQASLSSMQRHDDQQELQSLKQKLSSGAIMEDRAMSVRSVVATSRALHPCSRAFFAWSAFMRKQLLFYRQSATKRQVTYASGSSFRRNLLQSVVSLWRQWQHRNLALMHLEIAVSCLIVHRRLKNFFSLWSQTACLPAYVRMKSNSGSSDVLLSTRVARALMFDSFSHLEQSEQNTCFLSHVIRAFSSVKYSAALQAASTSFKLMKSHKAPSDLGSEANELCLLFSTCLKCITEQDAMPRLQVRS